MSMNVVIRSVMSSDVDVRTYRSPDPHNDGVWIRLMVGFATGPGEESFDVLVCTPLWLRDVVAEKGPQIGRHTVVMEPFDLDVAIAFLKNQVEAIEGKNWDDIGAKVGRLGFWEFEDYQP